MLLFIAVRTIWRAQHLAVGGQDTRELGQDLTILRETTVSAAVKQTWNTQASHGQILVLSQAIPIAKVLEIIQVVGSTLDSGHPAGHHGWGAGCRV